MKKSNRRNFIKTGATIGALTTLPVTAGKFIKPLNKSPERTIRKKVGNIRRLLPNQSFASMILGRLAFGITPGEIDIQYFNSLGGSNNARLNNFLDIQLNGGADPKVDEKIQEAGVYQTINMTAQEEWNTYFVNAQTNGTSRPSAEQRSLKYLRGVYSDYPLRERLADFWHNHFSIYAEKVVCRGTFSSWDREAIRGNMTGNFREMIEDTTKHVAMVFYLDNIDNTVFEPNENFARELLELHTMGAENYAGVIDQGDVPTITVEDRGGPFGSDGVIQAKFVENDVFEATRCLTGWRTGGGGFNYADNKHDRFQKSVLKGGFTNIPANQGVQDGYDLLDLAAFHPGTAKHIARKLIVFFLQDNPTQAYVDHVANVFYANRHNSNQLFKTYKAMFKHAEFKDLSNRQTKMTRPFDYLISLMRSTGCEYPFAFKYPFSTVNARMDYTGQTIFTWGTPDGIPHKSKFWMNSASFVQTWYVADLLIDYKEPNGDFLLPIVGLTVDAFQSASSRTPASIAEYWMKRIFGYQPPSGWTGDVVYEALVKFLMSRPNNQNPKWGRTTPIPIADIQSNVGPYRWNERIRGMVGMVASSPYFMQR